MKDYLNFLWLDHFDILSEYIGHYYNLQFVYTDFRIDKSSIIFK